MESTGVLRAFLFTDIVGATALKQRLGDVAGAQAISRHDVLFRSCLARHNGEEQVNPGDGFFASFALPSDALRCALGFQQGLAALDLPEVLTVRVGIHMGESVQVTDAEAGEGHAKLLGLAIDTTARVMAVAQAGQILLTRHAFDSVRQQVITAGDASPIEWRAHGPYVFKGVEDPLEVFEAGLPNLSPLTPPPDSQNARRVIAPGDEETLGWRPAAGLAIPGRESWELERKLGEGGFGEVWLARHQETRYVRAFKFCFQAERLRSLKRELKLLRLLSEALGDRPDIARLYEVSLQEPPYFLEMEYTAGGNLAEWVEKAGGAEHLPLERRLELVAQVGDALTAAHSVGVIHKDVKPANILIHEERDGRVQARLTDFGIGELLSKQRLKDAGMTVSAFEAVTQNDPKYGTLTGTQLYMAPELLAGQPPTVQTDVYALGVLLYQVVVGDLRRPIGHGWESEVADDVLRADIAACVAGEPGARLPTAGELSGRLRELERRRAARRSERRRRALLRVSSVAAGVLLLASAAAAVALWQVELARRDAVAAEARARIEAAKAEQVTSFLQEMLASANPEHARGEELTVRQVLDEAAQQLDGALANEPEVAAAIHATIGRTYYNLGVYAAAERHLRAACDLRRKHLGAEDPQTLGVQTHLGVTLLNQGRYEEAERLLRAVLEHQTRLLGEEHLDTLTTMNTLAEALMPLGKHEEAERLYRRSLQARERVLGPDHRDTFEAVNNLAAYLRTRNELGEAEELFRKNLGRQREVLGDDHPQTLGTLNNLAGVLKAQRKLDEAEKVYREALDALNRVLGEQHPDTLAAMNNLAGTLADAGKLAEAETLYRASLETLRGVLGDEHPMLLAVTNNLAHTLMRQGRHADAAGIYQELIANADRVLPEAHWYRWAFRGPYGECLTELERYAEAEEVLSASHAGLAAQYDHQDPRVRGAAERLLRLYEAWGKPDQADAYRPGPPAADTSESGSPAP